MANDLQIHEAHKFGDLEYMGYLPMYYENTDELAVNEHGYVVIQNAQGVRTNSLLRKDEWEKLDAAVLTAATGQLNAIDRLRSTPMLSEKLDSIGVLVSQYTQASQLTRPSVSLSGRAAPDFDRQDFDLVGVPIPVIHKEIQIGARELAASRRGLGAGIDVSHIYEASRVVAQELERIFFLGDANISLNGNILYGVTNQPDVNTGSATGGFDTLSNQVPTFRNMIIAAAGDNYFGPYEFWIARTQYNEMALNFYTDGSGDSGLDRIMKMSGVAAVHPSDWMTAGTGLLVTMDPNVLDLQWFQINQVVEWASPDGMAHNFKIMTVAAPRIKADYDGQSGIVYYTGL